MFAVFADKRSVVDHEFNSKSRFSEEDRRQLDDLARIAERIADRDFRNSSDIDDIANACFFHLDFFQAKIAFDADDFMVEWGGRLYLTRVTMCPFLILPSKILPQASLPT